MRHTTYPQHTVLTDEREVQAEPAVQEAKEGCFGFPRDNTIGGTRQPNEWTESWYTISLVSVGF
jgi:hypothetical protein